MTLFGKHAKWSGDVLADSAAMQREAAGLGFNWEAVADVVDKVREETDELQDALKKGDRGAAAHELGDVLLALINIACMTELEPQEVLRAANERFRDRFMRMRRLIESSGRRIEACTLRELDEAWNRIKDSDQ